MWYIADWGAVANPTSWQWNIRILCRHKSGPSCPSTSCNSEEDGCKNALWVAFWGSHHANFGVPWLNPCRWFFWRLDKVHYSGGLGLTAKVLHIASQAIRQVRNWLVIDATGSTASRLLCSTYWISAKRRRSRVLNSRILSSARHWIIVKTDPIKVFKSYQHCCSQWCFVEVTVMVVTVAKVDPPRAS